MQNKKKKTIIPCLCMTCGVRNDFSNPNGFCQNGHDDWFEYRDLKPGSQFFERAVKQSGLKPEEFTKLFLDPTNKLIAQDKGK